MSIKADDLVMVVRPAGCCGSISGIGRVFKVGRVCRQATYCIHCGHVENKDYAVFDNGYAADIFRLKKIDPPADGESLPTRKELEVTA